MLLLLFLIDVCVVVGGDSFSLTSKKMYIDNKKKRFQVLSQFNFKKDFSWGRMILFFLLVFFLENATCATITIDSILNNATGDRYTIGEIGSGVTSDGYSIGTWYVVFDFRSRAHWIIRYSNKQTAS